VRDSYAIDAIQAAHVCTQAGSHFQSSSHCPYPAPGVGDFYFTPLFSIGGFHFTKPMLLALAAAAVVVLFFWSGFRDPQVKPRRWWGAQNLSELGVLFVRDQILRPQLGRRGDSFLPFLTSLFFFIWLMNLGEIIPVILFPATSKIGIPLVLTLMVWITYLAIGIRSQGPIGYFKNMAVPSGAPWWILPLLGPLELLSNIFVRPFTLCIRLFANMLAGHLLLLVFYIATWYLFTLSIGLLFSVTSFVVTLLVTLLEVLITALQAFIFTTLTAFYFADSMSSAH